jgi:hypothetical protein
MTPAANLPPINQMDKNNVPNLKISPCDMEHDSIMEENVYNLNI